MTLLSDISTKTATLTLTQMFSGAASARIRSLFKDARKTAPSIVFIDEIDAIGKARSAGGMRDPGSAEREQGLLQLLVEMDGFSMDDKVLVIGATNRKDILDLALLRPGRFDRSIYMGKPGPENRKKILQVRPLCLVSVTLFSRMHRFRDCL